MEAKLKLMDMDGLVSSALDEAKNTSTDKKDSSQEVAVSKDTEMKAVEAALAHRIIGRISGTAAGYGYGYIPTYPLAYPLHPEVGKAVAAVNALHNSIIAYEYANTIAGLVAPSVDAVTKVLESITDTSGMKKDSKSTTSSTPAASSNLQLDAEGVPVLVNPVLLQNEVADVDLGMRNWVLEGVNGYDLLQLNGVPVLVNPESEILTNEVADARLNPCENVNGVSRICLVGPDDIAILQTEDSVKPNEAVTLQVHGVPVLVNPESELSTDEMGDARLNPCLDVNGKPRKCEVGPDEITIAQLEKHLPADAVTLQVNGVPVLVNPESELLTDEMYDAKLNPCVDLNGNARVCEVGPDEISMVGDFSPKFDDSVVLQVNGVPVLVNPESELLTNEMANARLQGATEAAWEVGPDNITATQQYTQNMEPVF